MAMNTILRGHVRKGKRIIPPLLNALGERYSPYSWARELVPQVMWIAILIDRYGFDQGTELANHLARTATECRSIKKTRPYITATSFSRLNKKQKSELLKRVDNSKLNKIRSSLREFNKIFPRNPLGFIYRSKIGPLRQYRISKKLSSLLKNMYDRNERISVLTMAAAMYLGISQGKILFGSEIGGNIRSRYKDIIDYPETESSRFAASAFRASAPMVLKGELDKADPKSERWLDYFWQRVAGIGTCEALFSIELDQDTPDDEIQNIITAYRNAAKTELVDRIKIWGFDLNNIEKFEVIGAILARQTTLATELASAPPTWTPHMAPLILRAMADVHITLVWILQDPEKRAKRFVDDGLGAVKLEIAHRRSELGSNSSDIETKEKMIEYLQMWVDSQRLDQFIEVNLGSWSGINTRKMAEEANCLDFYNFVYQPFSSATHSNWWHVSDKNSTYCLNPAHRHHRIPTILPANPDFHWLHLAAKYLEKSFSAFDAAENIRSKSEKSIEILEKNLWEPDNSE